MLELRDAPMRYGTPMFITACVLYCFACTTSQLQQQVKQLQNDNELCSAKLQELNAELNKNAINGDNKNTQPKQNTKAE